VPATDSLWVHVEDRIRDIVRTVFPDQTYVVGQTGARAKEYAEVGSPPDTVITQRWVTISGGQSHQTLSYLVQVEINVQYDDKQPHLTRWRAMNLTQQVINACFEAWKLDPSMGNTVLMPEGIRVTGPRMTTPRETERIDWTVTMVIELMGRFFNV
jgi:hypothetical protein